MRLRVLVAAVLGALLVPGSGAAAVRWAQADKQGVGTSAGTASKVWFTLGPSGLTEVSFPDLGTPSVRDLQLVVDGRPEGVGTTTATELLPGQGLTYRQITSDRARRWRITKLFVTDPRRNVVLADVEVASLTGRRLDVRVRLDPALDNGDGDRGRVGRGVLLARDGRVASALRAFPALRDTRSRTRDGRRTRDVRQSARLPVTGRPGARRVRLALGLGRSTSAADAAARASLSEGFGPVAAAYAAGWNARLRGRPLPRSVAGDAGLTRAYTTSLMVLAALEDKTYRGATVASPSMPWAWGDGSISDPSNAYHLVWPRDLYHVATALLAAGDRAGAERALTFLFARAQQRGGLIPKNVDVDGTKSAKEVQLDEIGLPLVLAWQLGRDDLRTYREHVRPAAELLLRDGPITEQERWENQSGYSPSTLASLVAGLVCAGDLARRVGDLSAAARYEATADRWRSRIDAWTFTTTGALAPHGYHLRLTKAGRPNSGATYALGDGGPRAIDERMVVDPSFLELVRLGVRAADDPAIVATTRVVDDVLRVETSKGPFWHRYTLDGYGEARDGGQWEISKPGSAATVGRAWPLLAGERGEYELAAGRVEEARALLRTVARSGTPSGMLPEQVWDLAPPATGGPDGEVPGTPTRSATPLGWTHAQLVRLAWSLDAGRPVETPRVVACRYNVAPCP